MLDSMRILVHDFAGHPFQVELSRALAQRGHTVHHVYCASLQTTPQGRLERMPDDPSTFTSEGLTVQGYDREKMLTRWRGDRAYGRALARATHRFRPDVVLSANTPLDAQAILLQAVKQQNIRLVYWLQDLIGEASYRLLRQRIPVAGAFIGRYYQALESRLLRQSDAVVLITEDFRPILHQIGVPDAKLSVVENWAPLDDLPPRPQDNPWSRAQRLAGQRVILYTGTLGMKHNPALLLSLAERFRDQPDVYVVVCSQGRAAEWLREQAQAASLPNLRVLGFQPFELLPDVFGSATLLTAILEEDAGVFSVPSKVLSYLCAKRALLLAIPTENLAARLVLREQAGLVVSPRDVDAFTDAAVQIMSNESLRGNFATRGRAYAERTFELNSIVERFEPLLTHRSYDP